MPISAHHLTPFVPIRNWKMRLHRVRPILTTVILCGLLGVLAAAQDLRLELHKPVERDIAPGGADIFRIDLQAGQFVHVVAQQEGIDVVLAVIDPKGREAVSTDSPNRDFGPEPASAIAADTGTYEIRVTAKRERPLTGKYRLELLELRAPTAEDRLRLQAEDLFRSAIADDRAGTKDTWNHAVEETVAPMRSGENSTNPMRKHSGCIDAVSFSPCSVTTKRRSVTIIRLSRCVTV